MEARKWPVGGNRRQGLEKGMGSRRNRREDLIIIDSNLVSTSEIGGNSTREQPPLDPLLGKEGKQGRFKIPMVADRHINLAINPQFATYHIRE